MKQSITLTLIILSIACFGQDVTAKANQVKAKEETIISPEKKISFSPYESGELAEFETNKKQLIKLFKGQDSLQMVFLQKLLIRNGVDLSRLSQHKDSLNISEQGITYILKPKKK